MQEWAKLCRALQTFMYWLKCCTRGMRPSRASPQNFRFLGLLPKRPKRQMKQYIAVSLGKWVYHTQNEFQKWVFLLFWTKTVLCCKAIASTTRNSFFTAKSRSLHYLWLLCVSNLWASERPRKQWILFDDSLTYW